MKYYNESPVLLHNHKDTFDIAKIESLLKKKYAEVSSLRLESIQLGVKEREKAGIIEWFPKI